MDLFDEFEMKPITDGLGFHKKAVRLNDKISETKALKDEINLSLPKAPPEGFMAEGSLTTKSDKEILSDLLSSLDPIAEGFINDEVSGQEAGSAPSLQISQTLPRIKANHAAPIDTVLPEIPMVDMPNISEVPVEPKTPMRPIVRPVKPSDTVQRGASNTPKPRFTAKPISLGSIVLDGIIIFALSLIFLVSLLMVTGVDLLTVVSNSKADLTTQISMGILYIAVLQMYVVVSRSFFGKTLAEWTFDLQMGSDKEQRKALYPIKVVWRSLLVVVTGIVVLPFLSFVTRRDVLSYFTGLQLYQRHD